MRVATFNILHGRSPADDRVDLDRYVDAVAGLDADVLALQEVDRHQPRSASADLTTLAADAMGAPEHRFVAALSGSPGAMWIAADGNEQPDTAAYGVALLSRYPVRSWEVVRLAPAPVRAPHLSHHHRRRVRLVHDEPRVAVAATVESPLGPMMIANTHLTFLSWWNRRQLRLLRRSLLEHIGPLVLTGDLNMGRAAAERHSRMRSLAEASTFPATEPSRQLDHILATDGLESRVKDFRTHPLPLSDHLALSVDLA